MTLSFSRRDIDPDVLAELLVQFDWRPLSISTEQPYQVWRNDFVEQDVLVPTDPSRPDFEDLLWRAYRVLADDHGPQFERSARYLTFQKRSSLSATRWIKESSLDDGLIAWELGERTFEVARRCLSAAAKAAKEPRRYYGGAADYISKRFLEETFMGQTEIGSFIVTAYTPSDRQFFFSKSAEQSASSKMLSVESRSGEEIVERLETVVAGVRSALDDYRQNPNDEIFDELIPVGLSYEMSDALATLSTNGDGAVRFSRHTQRHSTREYVIKSVESPVLARVANRLAVTREPQTVNLLGEVTLLDHVSTEEAHIVRLHVSNNPMVRTVRVRLSPDDYKKAIDAHKNDIPLRVSGLVEKEGRYNWIYAPTSVTTAPDATNDDDDVPDEIPTEPQDQLSLLDDSEET